MTTPNPGDPRNTDEENLTVNQAEELIDDAAAAQGVDEDRDDATVEPDPAVEPEVAEEELDAPAEPSLEDQLAERTDDLQRVSAEYANFRRRTAKERQQVIDNAKASVLTELLPILDDLDLARRHGDLDDGPLKGVADKIAGVFTAQKVESFGEEGDAFDPEVHEAVQDLSNGDEKVLGTVLRRGYRLGERVIRTAMVIIADPEPSAEEPEN